MQKRISLSPLLCVFAVLSAASFAQPASSDTSTTAGAGRICYIKSQKLWIAKEDGTEARELMPEGNTYNHQLSPDGATVAYTLDSGTSIFAFFVSIGKR